MLNKASLATILTIPKLVKKRKKGKNQIECRLKRTKERNIGTKREKGDPDKFFGI